MNMFIIEHRWTGCQVRGCSARARRRCRAQRL